MDIKSLISEFEKCDEFEEISSLSFVSVLLLDRYIVKTLDDIEPVTEKKCNDISYKRYLDHVISVHNSYVINHSICNVDSKLKLIDSSLKSISESLAGLVLLKEE